jgi:hypothetical protein
MTVIVYLKYPSNQSASLHLSEHYYSICPFFYLKVVKHATLHGTLPQHRLTREEVREGVILSPPFESNVTRVAIATILHIYSSRQHIRWKPTSPWKLQSESHDVDPTGRPEEVGGVICKITFANHTSHLP